MKKPAKITIAVLIAAFVILISYFLGFLSFLNAPVNYILWGPIDRSCNADSDCVMRSTSCDVSCSCPVPVNKDWNKKCFFGYKHPGALCEVCMFPREIKCINNTCTALTKEAMSSGP